VAKLEERQAQDKHNRIEECNTLETSLADQLPELHLHITATHQHTLKLHQTLSKENLSACRNLLARGEEGEREWEAGRRKVREMLASTAREISEEMQKECEERQQSKLRLLTLWETATSKIQV
jgi:hypothetical protein